jgi:hypothetical protein
LAFYDPEFFFSPSVVDFFFFCSEPETLLPVAANYFGMGLGNLFMLRETEEALTNVQIPQAKVFAVAT